MATDNKFEQEVRNYSHAPNPSKGALELLRSRCLFVSGRFVGAGKDTIISELVNKGFQNIPTAVTRPLRPGEVNGIHKVQATVEDLAMACRNQTVLEIERLGDYWYATDTAYADPGAEGYVKDVEWKGIRQLRRLCPDLKVIVPLAPLEPTPRKVTAWEERVVARHSWHRGISTLDQKDLQHRLEGVVEAADMLLEDGAPDDPNVLIFINGDLGQTRRLVSDFVDHGTSPHNREKLADHLFRKRALATQALQQCII